MLGGRLRLGVGVSMSPSVFLLYRGLYIVPLLISGVGMKIWATGGGRSLEMYGTSAGRTPLTGVDPDLSLAL